MKKYLALSLACVLSLSAFAQEEIAAGARETKKSKEYLPAAGDVTLGLNLLPFLNYFGNMLNGNTDNGLSLDQIGGNAVFPINPGMNASSFSIFGKYFLTDRTAVRVNLGVGVNTKTHKYYVDDQSAMAIDPLAVDQVVDHKKINQSGFSLALGYEWRRGYRRLQGFWGGQLLLGYTVDKNSYSYGNAITEANQNPQTSLTDAPIKNIGGNSRLLSANNGSTFTGGIGGFTGVEYYIAPKIAIGCEVSLNMLWRKTGKSSEITERFNDSFNRVDENTRFISPGQSGFHFGTENIGTSLYVAFSF